MKGMESMTKLRPDYYKGKDGKDLFARFESGLLTKEQVHGFYVGNVMKYITRYQGKNGVEDLKKARTYLDRLIRFEEQSKEKQDEGDLFEVPKKNQSQAIVEKQREVFGNGVE